MLVTSNTAEVDMLKTPKPGFEEVIKLHFRHRKVPLLKKLHRWVEEVHLVPSPYNRMRAHLAYRHGRQWPAMGLLAILPLRLSQRTACAFAMIAYAGDQGVRVYDTAWSTPREEPANAC
eukprot:COSAG02_NODE_11811_length_1650_cov_0.945197_1_plen_119_part_00